MLLYSITPRFDMEVTVGCAMPGEECPMMLESMDDFRLDFAKQMVVVEGNPGKCKITLPCKHSFSALACLYYFARKGMRCPMCRDGCDTALDFDCLPIHMRQTMREHVVKTNIEERIEEEAETTREVMEMYFNEIENDFGGFIDTHRVVLVAYCYDDSMSVNPLVSFDYDLVSDIVDEELQMSIPRGSLRNFTRSIARVAPMEVVQFAIGMRGPRNDFVFLDRSPKIELKQLSVINTLLGIGLGQFVIETLRGEDTKVFANFKWCITLDNFRAWLQMPRGMHFVQGGI